eukprot:TRINITY_DN6113_c0_g1_i1.p1 TRINITY_DN6113_c0_g1~~TRINITY_DN6113_c0_g1_i1.p1  ORF type:complete len:157 (-),score=7.53 TRINITY_DN6113_c0_g1_i1:34-504(-)
MNENQAFIRMEQYPVSKYKSSCDVQQWLMDLHLPEYFRGFIVSGYCGLPEIANISAAQELVRIGVENPYHQKILANAIQILNGKDVMELGSPVMKKTRCGPVAPCSACSNERGKCASCKYKCNCGKQFSSLKSRKNHAANLKKYKQKQSTFKFLQS